MADKGTKEDRAEVLNMARIWEDLARDHEEAGRRTKLQEARTQCGGHKPKAGMADGWESQSCRFVPGWASKRKG